MAYTCLSDTETKTYHVLSNSLRGKAAYLYDFFLSQLRCIIQRAILRFWMTVPMVSLTSHNPCSSRSPFSRSSLANHVFAIVFSSSNIKMGLIYAGPIVARMKDEQSCSNRTNIDFVRQSGGSDHGSAGAFCPDNTIAIGSGPYPSPAAVFLNNLFPKSFVEGFGVFPRSCHV